MFSATVVVMVAMTTPLTQAFLICPSLPVGTLHSGRRIVRPYGRSNSRAAASCPNRSFSSSLAMAVAGPDDDETVVVCGPRSGIAGLVASRLSKVGGLRQVRLTDPTMTLPEQLEGAKVIVASSDGGIDGEEAPSGLADEIVEFLPRSAEYLIWVDSPESRAAARAAKAEIGVFGNLLGQGFKEPLEAVRGVAGDIKCVIIHAGNLFGSSGGEEPVPFLTGPKAEPVLDESITRQAVLVGPGTVLSTPEDAKTKRSSIAEAIERLLDGPEGKRGLELSVVSVEGFPTTDAEWEEELSRLDDSMGVAVFSIDFESIDNRDQLVRWLVDSWGPSALRRSTAAMLRSGARPVAVSPTVQGLELVWETLTEDLTAVQAGKLSINIINEPAGIRVTRVAGPGQPQGKSLIGEEEIVQTLLEGINTVAYPKAFVQRKKLKKAATPDISVEAVKEAMAKAGASATPGAEAAAVESKESLPLPAATTAAVTEPPANAPSKGRGRRSGGKRKSR